MSTQTSYREHTPTRRTVQSTQPGILSRMGGVIERHPYAAGAGALALFIGANVGIDKIEHSRHPYGIVGESDKSQQTASFKRLDTVAGVKLVLRAGSQLRYTPKKVDGDVSGKNNIAATVPAGKEFVTDLPVLKKGSNWMAIKLPDVQGPLTPNNAVYANVTALEGQIDTKGNSYALTYSLSDGPKASSAFSPDSGLGALNTPVASTEMLDAGAFEKSIGPNR